ncbi:MAG: pyrroloquinoline quinone biosynthesis protein PqqB [Parvibaculaceae bacterium]
MRIIVLGSAAGGGFPQWNCRCGVCALYWQGDPRVRARTQSSIAVTANKEKWLLLDCSPDVRAQIMRTPALHPPKAGRGSTIEGVFLTNGDIDHTAGLLSLREDQAFVIHGTASVLAEIARNRMFAVVSEAAVPRKTVELDRPVTMAGGLVIEPFAVPGKAPLYCESGDAGGEWTIGLRIGTGARHFYYVPGCADIDATLRARLKDAPLVLFDGTLWRDDEMIRQGIGHKTGRRMGHVSMAGTDGAIARLGDLGIRRRIFIHINNSNPVLVDGSPERREAEAAGWEIAHDGMVIEP